MKRRDFLKTVGCGTAALLAGCATDPKQATRKAARLRLSQAARPAQHSLADLRGHLARPGLLRPRARQDPELGQAGGRRGQVHQRLRHRPGLFGLPLGVHDRDVPDQHRRAPSSQPSRRRVRPASAGGRHHGILPAGRLLHLQRCGTQLQAERQDRLELHAHDPSRSTAPTGRSASRTSRSSPRSISTYTHRDFKRDKKNPIDPNKVELPPYYPDHPLARRDWADYLESVQLLDTRDRRRPAMARERGHGQQHDRDVLRRSRPVPRPGQAVAL